MGEEKDMPSLAIVQGRKGKRPRKREIPRRRGKVPLLHFGNESLRGGEAAIMYRKLSCRQRQNLFRLTLNMYRSKITTKGEISDKGSTGGDYSIAFRG